MKRKFFKVAAAAVMALVCLSGCSAGFSSKSLLSAVEKCGMKECPDQNKFGILLGGTGDDASYYAVFNDKERINVVCTTLLGVDTESGAKECIACIEWKMDEDDYLCNNTIYCVTAKNNAAAQVIYEKLTAYGLHGQVPGEDNGVTYTIGYIGAGSAPVHDSFSGVYLKGNTLIYIRGNCYSDYDNDLVESVCKDLGLVSPYTLKET